MSDGFDVEIALQEDRPEQATACVFELVAMDQIGAALGQMLPKVAQWLGQGHGELAGPPYARYHAGPDGKFELEAGSPVAAPVVGDGVVRAETLPGGRCAVATFHGSYEHLRDGHAKLQEWMSEQCETSGGDPWEMYVTDPTSEADPTKWETVIVHPLRAR